DARRRGRRRAGEMSVAGGTPMQTEMLIGGEFAKGAGEEEAVLNPRTGETIVRLPDASPGQVEAAVTAADAAFARWSRTTPAERAALLLKLADRIEAE